MALVKFSNGPLGGEEREIADPNMLPAECPGYSAVEQVMDPEKGQVVKAEWNGDESAEASYKNSPQEAERLGNETGVRDEKAQDRLQGERRGEKTGAERREGDQARTAQQSGSKESKTDGKHRSDQARKNS